MNEHDNIFFHRKS